MDGHEQLMVVLRAEPFVVTRNEMDSIAQRAGRERFDQTLSFLQQAEERAFEWTNKHWTQGNFPHIHARFFDLEQMAAVYIVAECNSRHKLLILTGEGETHQHCPQDVWQYLHGNEHQQAEAATRLRRIVKGIKDSRLQRQTA